MKRYTRLTILVLIGLMSTAALGQKLYRWVDKEGNVHYSDQVPPEDNDQARDELNQKGRVVDSVAEAATDDEIQALNEQQQRLHDEQLKLEIQRLEDKKLEDSYAGEDQIIRNMDQKLAGLDMSIRNATNFIETQADSLSSMEQRKAKVEAEGGSISGALQSMIDDLNRQVKQQEEILQTKTAERNEVVSHYDDELARYRAMLARKKEREGDS